MPAAGSLPSASFAASCAATKSSQRDSRASIHSARIAPTVALPAALMPSIAIAFAKNGSRSRALR